MILAFFAAIAFQNQGDGLRVESLTGKFEVVEHFESKILKNERTVTVYLPPTYETSKSERFPVLYCHDGQNIFDGRRSYIPNQEWRIDEAAEALIKAKLIPPMIIVGIDNAQADRAAEYLPWKFKMANGQEFGGRGDLYAKFLVEEVKPFVDKKYRTKKDAKNTSLLGSSFGGVTTYYVGLKYPEVFSKLAVVSPSVWTNDRILIQQTKDLPKKLPLKIWIDIGTQESKSAAQDTRDLVQAIESKGWVLGRDLAYYEDGFAQHNELAWSRRVPAMLLWLFGGSKG